MLSRIGVVAMVCACGGGGSSAIDAPAPVDPRTVVAVVPVSVNRNLDLLFVIDDSNGMAEHQTNLVNNFPNFINTLNSIEGGLPDVHIGVVSADMGTKGVNGAPGPGVGTVGQGGCANTGDDGKLQTSGAMVTGSFISDIKQTDGTRLKNYTGTLEQVFSQMARLGATGCGFEQPLHSMQRALQNTAANPGFLRPDANLGIVFLGDEDDCSLTDPSLLAAGDTGPLGPLTSFRCTRFGVTCQVGGKTTDEMNTIGEKINCGSNPSSTFLENSTGGFATFLKGLKTNPRKIFVAGIIGNPTPLAVEARQINGMNQIALAHSCSFQGPTGPVVADPGIRLKRFLDEFPNSRFETICQPDQSQALVNIADLARRVVGDPCIRAELAMPLDCIVEDEAGPTKTPLSQCGVPETAPCWKIVSDQFKCPAIGGAPSQLLQIVRTVAPSPETVTTMRCKLAS